MKILSKIILFAAVIVTFGCSKEDTVPTVYEEESFLPMHIGNYWKIDENNFTQIDDTLRIGGDLYYEFYSLTGGDVLSTQYLRIDDNQNLIETFPKYPDFKFIHAKFDAPLGSTFWTINDESVNDFKVTVKEKAKTLRSFEYQVIYHPNLNDKHTRTFIRGLGWDGYNEVQINGKIYEF